MRSKITAGGVGLAVSALAALSASPAGASQAPAAVKTVTLTVAGNGITVLASKGERVVVELSGHHLRWSVARVTQSTPVLKLVSEGITTTGASKTVFRVVNYGTAHLDATATPICSAATGCPQYVVLWHAGISVPVVDPPPPAAS